MTRSATRAGASPAPGLTVGLALLAAAGCGLAPRAPGASTVGRPNAGWLPGGVPLPDRGEGYVRARPGEATRWGTPRLVGAIERAAAAVARRYPGGAPLRVGDLSWPRGGRHPRHGSHRSGRDVDLLFYLVGAAGQPTRGRGWLAIDRFGVAREDRRPGGVPGSGALFFLDEARSWWLVRSLLADPEAPVQWIFVSNGVKARLLDWARRHEPDPALLFQAIWTLHEPSRGAPHDDHFHVRLACTAEERATGCDDYGPIWPWLRKAIEKPAERVTAAAGGEALGVRPSRDQKRRPGPTTSSISWLTTGSPTWYPYAASSSTNHRSSIENATAAVAATPRETSSRRSSTCSRSPSNTRRFSTGPRAAASSKRPKSTPTASSTSSGESKRPLPKKKGFATTRRSRPGTSTRAYDSTNPPSWSTSGAGSSGTAESRSRRRCVAHPAFSEMAFSGSASAASSA